MSDYWQEHQPSTEYHQTEQAPQQEPFVFEELSLWDALWLFIYRPVRVTRNLFQVMLDIRPGEIQQPDEKIAPSEQSSFEAGPDITITSTPPEDISVLSTDEHPAGKPLWWERIRPGLHMLPRREKAGEVVFMAMALGFALFGAAILREHALDIESKETNDLGGSVFWLMFGALNFLLLALVQSRQWWRAQFERFVLGKAVEANTETSAETEPDNPRQSVCDETANTAPRSLEAALRDFFNWFERHSIRFGLVPLAILFSWFAYDRNVELNDEGQVVAVVFTTFGTISWFSAILLWYLSLGVDLNGLFARLRQRFRRALLSDNTNISAPRQPQKRQRRRDIMPILRLPFGIRWTHLALIGVVFLAAYFRLNDLEAAPPDMTSDHIEKLRDAIRVDEGHYAVFFENNGGREAFQMYLVAAIADWGDVGFTFETLKLATALEGILTVVLAYWLGKTLIGYETQEKRQFGDWVGLSMAALLAISSWHTMLSRLGLRIALTPLTGMLATIFLARAIRHNRRIDYVNLGLVLGFGMYFYQANRMLPILVVIMIGLAALVALIRWQPEVSFKYLFNLGTAGLLAIVIYLPMYRYSQEFPAAFWNRTYGRMFGEQAYSDCVNPETGLAEFCSPSLSEVWERFLQPQYVYNDELPTPPGEDPTLHTGPEMMRINYEDALVMFMWEGDVQFISNGDSYPALDNVTNALLVLGVAVWLVLLVRRKFDLTLLIIPAGVLIMFLPSTLAVYFNSENPSFTRASGTIPFIFFLAALPLAYLARLIIQTGRQHALYYGSALLVTGFLVYSAVQPNENTYFEVYREGYEESWPDYSAIAAPMQDFAEGRGSYGNVWYVHWPNWLDHRILGASAGDLDWNNALWDEFSQGRANAETVYFYVAQNKGTAYEYDPDKPMMFLVNKEDKASLQFLEEYFPDGSLSEIDVSYNRDFYVYEAPPGWDWLTRRITTQTTDVTCIINCRPGPE